MKSVEEFRAIYPGVAPEAIEHIYKEGFEHGQAGTMHALRESVKLQRHYAEQLNGWDGGHRLLFPSAEAWIKRITECADTAATAKQTTPQT